MPDIKQKIVIIYHGNCLDGFGGAYAAWKKFGNDAYYHAGIERSRPEIELSGKEVYIVDYSYPKDVLLDLEKRNSRLVILDHHLGVEGVVQSVKEHVFDNDHSGAVITWKYFHPKKPIPKLLSYVEDGDLWKFSLPSAKEISYYLSTVSFDFELWNNLAFAFEDEAKLKELAGNGKLYKEYSEHIYANLTKQAELVSFEGYEIFAVNAPRIFRSELGNMLAKLKAPFSIVWYQNNGKWHFSLRGDGTIDLTKIAGKYGGSGHKNAAAFRLPLGSPFPWKPVDSQGKIS